MYFGETRMIRKFGTQNVMTCCIKFQFHAKLKIRNDDMMTLKNSILLLFPSIIHGFYFYQQPVIRNFHSQISSSNNGNNNNNNNDWMESLRARQLELDHQQQIVDYNWRNSKCKSSLPLSFPDWVRRLDMGDYPLVAVGSSSGNIFCANLETGKALARSYQQEDEEELEGLDDILNILYSSYDGGGTIAIAMHKDLICSAGRQGSVQLWRVHPEDTKLISQGSLQALRGTLVTCLHLDDDYLWVGTSDGRLQAYSHQSSDLPLALQTKPELEWNLGSPILSMSLCPSMGYGVVSTAKGTVEMFSMEDEVEIIAQWKPPISSSNTYILSSAIVQYKDGDRYTLVCGCSDGTMYMQPLTYENGMFPDDDNVFQPNRVKRLNPRHGGLVKCLTSPTPGILLSGGQDGSLRVWNISSEDDSYYLYQFIGYKVWLGTVWTDGSRLLSDGADNAVILHDFSDADP
jgi:WD40 repeat protein